ncbi:MAG TPA: GMC family oxidoreductase [Steroidobacteraceae bacterium]
MNRRDILKIFGLTTAAPLLPSFLQAQRGPHSSTAAGRTRAGAAPADYAVVVIGSGFGGTMTALAVARELERRNKGEKMLILERGAWWTTPVGTVQDKEVQTAAFLRDKMKQPVQYWSSVENLMGLADILLRCVRRPDHEDGLYDLTKFGKNIGKASAQDDGVTVVRASGVGGGSLVYANVTIQPPRWIFEDERWPLSWDARPDATQRGSLNDYYETARDAIGFGVLYALQKRAHRYGAADKPPDSAKVNTGLSNIVTRSAPLQPHWKKRPDPNNPNNSKRLVRYINLNLDKTAPDPLNHLWLDRARVFQTAMSQLTPDFGTVDSSINDIDPEPELPGPVDNPETKQPPGPVEWPGKNYCERQGRCIVGCLPGARHTLNKQLMRAILGGPNTNDPTGPDLSPILNPTDPSLISLWALSEVDLISARPEGGYEIRGRQRDRDKLGHVTPLRITADRVIVAAGCIGTNLLLLRSKEGDVQTGAHGLPELSDKVGYGFSTNGDYLAFLDNTRERVSLTRGPITTSFGHFNTTDKATGGDPRLFHTIEDNGIPRALSAVIGYGIPVLRAVSVGGGQERGFALILRILREFLKKLHKDIGCLLKHSNHRPDILRSEDEVTARMMCVAAMGREASVGQFRLGRSDRETELRVARSDGKQFYDDPIYAEIRATLCRVAKVMGCNADTARFVNPLVEDIADSLGGKSIGISHPLGGCRMAKSVADGVADEFGRVFRKTQGPGEAFYPGLYVADAALIPTALGVNPSLTISALALRVADKVIDELPKSD